MNDPKDGDGEGGAAKLERWKDAAREATKIVVLSCTLLALTFPAAELLGHASGGAWAEPVAFLGSFALPFLLYLFLAVLLLDVTFVKNVK